MVDPFDNLEVKAANAKGREWFFHMSRDGRFSAKLFQAGKRIFGRHDTGPYKDCYFIPAKNFKGKAFGLVAAMRRKSKGNGQVADESTNFNFVLVDGIHFDGTTLLIRYHEWTGMQNFDYLLAEDTTTNLERKLKKSFRLNLEAKVSEIEVIYLNSVLCCRTGVLWGMNLVCDGNETIRNGGLECSLKDCDKWKLNAQTSVRYKPYSMPQSIILDDSCKISNKRQRGTEKKFSKMRARGRGETTLYLMKLVPMDVAEHFFTIFHSFSECKKFVYLAMLTIEQLKW